jgi:hypothetical protein
LTRSGSPQLPMGDSSPLKGLAMTERTLWLSVLTTLSLLCASQVTPASAWDGFNRFGTIRMPSRIPMQSPGISMRRQMDVRHSLRVRDHHLQPQGSLPVAIWPYEPYIDTPLTEVAPTESEAAPAPQVIIIPSDNPARFRPTRPEAPLDFSYVPECRAIPNGYHCGDHQGGTSLDGSAKAGDGARGGGVGLGLSD